MGSGNNDGTCEISFWDDVIDSIWWLNEIFIWNNKALEFATNFNTLYDIPDEVLTILDSLDFYSSYDEISSTLTNFIIFNSLSNNEGYINL